MKATNVHPWWKSILGMGPTQDELVEQDLVEQVNAAHREWEAAQSYFEMVSEPELVDHAIYNLEAARRKYIYLFNQLRQQKQGSADPEE
ncbi:MAG: DUF2508 family protein [Mycobacterium leprae]